MDEVVFVAIVAARFVVPLGIPRFPLPAIVAALVIDAADQTIFAAFDVEPENYQGYDKALDIFYLTVAYISTLRNWTEDVAFRTAQVLWYYRLAGVVAFELTGARALLLVFPNTFEYFFVFYEVVRLRWNPIRLGTRQVIGAAAAIWVFVKLPQEWWIHIAKLDVTDMLADHPWSWLVLMGAIVAAIAAVLRLRPGLPPPDWPASFDVDAHPTTVERTAAEPLDGTRALINHPLVEKTLLVGLVTTVFLQLLPDNELTLIEVVLGAGVVIALNSFVGGWLSGRGRTWAFTGASFLGTGLINLGIVVGLRLFSRTDENQLGGLLTFFTLALLTFIVTLYDRFRLQRLDSTWPLRRARAGTR